MKDYHPGQGVYRSSYKNALRLAATETNKAFRTADYERWQNMDFVTGIEVERSPTNHGPCPVCDAKGWPIFEGFQVYRMAPVLYLYSYADYDGA